MMLNPNFVHPLSEVDRVKIDGEELEGLNFWAVASLVFGLEEKVNVARSNN
jgi:hypothetical protein